MDTPGYDKEGQDNSNGTERDFFNAHPERQRNNPTDNESSEPEVKKELDEEDLAAAESDTSSVEESSPSENAEKGRFESEDLYKAEGGAGNWTRKIRRRRTYIFIVTALILPMFALIGLIVFSGPLKLIHIGNMLQKFHFGPNETSQNSRIGRVIEFARTAGPNGDKSRRNVGGIAEALSSKYQNDLRSKGISIDYDRPLNPDGSSGGRSRVMQSLTIDAETPEGRRTLDALRAEGFDIPDNPRGSVNVPFRGESARLRRKALNITVEAQGKRGIATAISKRLLRVRAGVDFHPLKNLQNAGRERWEDWKAERKRERAERNRTGVDPVGDRILSGEPNIDPETGEPVPNPDADGAASGGTGLVNEAGGADTPDKKLGVVEKLRSSMLGRVAGGAAAAVGILCMVKDIGNEIPKVQHTSTILPLVRAGMEFVAISSQIMAYTQGVGPPPSLDEMRALSEEVDYIDPENSDNNSYFVNAESIERNNGVARGGEPLPEDLQVVDNSGEKPFIFDFVDGIPGLGTACGAINTVTGFVKKIPLIGSAVSFAETLQEAAINTALSAAGTSMDEVMMAIVKFFAGETVDLANAVGAELGGIADLGVFLAEKEHGIGLGGGDLTNAELTAINMEFRSDLYRQQSEKTMLARLFNPLESDSLAAQLILQNPSVTPSLKDPLGNVASLATSALTSVGSLGSLFTGKAKAADPIPVDYGVPASGFSLETLENEILADPSANADIIEPQLADLNKKYEGCFGTVVEPDSFALKIGESIHYGEDGGTNDPKCKEGGETLLRYRMYILDIVTLRSMACYEGLDDVACREIGIDDSASASTPSGPSTISAPGLNGYTIGCRGIPAMNETRGARGDNIDWTGIPDSGTIGTTSAGQPIKVYIREPCTQTNVKTVVIASSIHASENYGQPVSFELLFRKTLPENMRVIAIPEINGSGIPPSVAGRVNSNGVNLNRNYDYRWNSMRGDELNSSSSDYRGPSPASEPETQAVTSFLLSLGDSVSVLLAYHDNLNYVGSSNDTDKGIARSYHSALSEGGVSMGLGNSGGISIYQVGSLDGWYNATTSKPALLVEMPGTASSSMLSTHADAVISLVRDGVI